MAFAAAGLLVFLLAGGTPACPASLRGRAGAAIVGRERIEVTFRRRGAAVAATNDASAGVICNRRDVIHGRELNARGWAARRRQGRDEHAPGACGWRALLVAARNLASHSAARGDHATDQQQP